MTMAEIRVEYQQTRVIAIIRRTPSHFVILNLKKRIKKAANTPYMTPVMTETIIF
jgi:hypothetical protein